jgi:hypothetical protein
MKLPRWIWPLNRVGAIAVANLAIFGLCGLLHLCLFPGGVVHVNQEPRWKLATDEALAIAMMSVSFPVGSLGFYFHGTDMPGPPLLDVIFVPLNAYVWGWIGASAWRRHRQEPLWVFKCIIVLLALLAALLLTVAPFWLLRALRGPGEWDLLILCAGTAAFSLFVFTVRRAVRSKRLAMQEGQRAKK